MADNIQVILKNIRMSFGSNEVLKGISLDIPKSEFLTLLGPSGCGKTTLLRIVAGFVKPNSGEILIGGSNVTKKEPYERGLGMVFQNYALWPHMNVEDHISFGLKLLKLDKQTISDRIMWAINLVGLSGLEKRFPAELSGGQQQRVALARAISLQPNILLLDEPLSNLDRKLRDEMRVELRDLQRKLGITTIYVTHDQTEALTMSDRIAVMRKGEIIQIANPYNLYETPVNEFVANFLGASNLLPVTVLSISDGVAEVLIEGKKLIVPISNMDFQKKEAYLLLRSENIEISSTITGHQSSLCGTIAVGIFEGKEVRYTINLKHSQLSLVLALPNTNKYYINQNVDLHILKATLVEK